jgi:hypothetical protein
MTLTITDLFTPAPSGVNLDPNLPAPDGSWLQELLSIAGTLGLPTTSWQPGGPERTILSIASVALSQEDVIVSVMAQGGFLDFAASGTVSYVALDGTTVVQPVTPDPSIPSQNPNGAPGWLDALGQSFFKVRRLPATYASGRLAIVNTGVGTLNYNPGAYHAANTNTGSTYSNVDSLSVPPSLIAGAGGTITNVAPGATITTVSTSGAHGLAVGDVVYAIGALGVSSFNERFATVSAIPSATSFEVPIVSTGSYTSGGLVYLATRAQFAADVIGLDSNAAPGVVTTSVTAGVGVRISNPTAWSASTWESNTSYAARCRLKLGALSPNGPSQAYTYYALTAQQLLLAQTPSVTLTNGPIVAANTFSTPATGEVTVVVASTTPASVVLGDPVTPGCVQLDVIDASNATPIVIQTVSDHGLSDDDFVTTYGILGNTGANGTFQIIVLTSDTFSLNDSVGTGAYIGGGAVEGGDLGQVDNLIQSAVVPDRTIAITESALAFPITVVATVIVPQTYVSVYGPAALTALQNLIAAQPIGGNIPEGEVDGTIPVSIVEGALVAAGVQTLGAVSYVREVSSLSVNGVTTDATFPTPSYKAVLSAPTINVVGV